LFCNTAISNTIYVILISSALSNALISLYDFSTQDDHPPTIKTNIPTGSAGENAAGEL
jgi:hypothetical protein